MEGSGGRVVFVERLIGVTAACAVVPAVARVVHQLAHKMPFAEHKKPPFAEHKWEDNKELFMSRIVTVVLVACVASPLAAQAQGKRPMSDSDYCAALSERYVRYVGRSEARPHSPVRPAVTGGVGLSHCKERYFATTL